MGGSRGAKMGTVFPLFRWAVYMEALVSIYGTRWMNIHVFILQELLSNNQAAAFTKHPFQPLKCYLPDFEITIHGINFILYQNKTKSRVLR